MLKKAHDRPHQPSINNSHWTKHAIVRGQTHDFQSKQNSPSLDELKFFLVNDTMLIERGV